MTSKLFSIETNLNPSCIILPDFLEFNNVLKYFSIKGIVDIKKIIKKNNNSEIYIVKSSSGEFVLRSCPYFLKDRCVSQSQIINSLSDNLMVKPIYGEDGYIFLEDDLCWLCFPYVRGQSFNGDFQKAGFIFKSTYRLFLGLDAVCLTEHQKSILSFSHNNISDQIIDENLSYFHKRVQEYGIDNDLFKAFLRDIYYIVDLIYFVKSSERMSLVHNDVNFSNLLVRKNEILFIDIEDICWGYANVAFVHGLFKILRHCIFVRAVSVEHAQDFIIRQFRIYREVLPSFYDQDYVKKLLHFRISCDILSIIENSVQRGCNDGLYDLNKKLQNYTEVSVLFRGGMVS